MDIDDKKCKCCEVLGTTEIVKEMIAREERAEMRHINKENKKKELSTVTPHD